MRCKTRRIEHNREVAIYAVLTFIAMLSLTLMVPVIEEFIIDRFDVSNTEASMFFFLKKTKSWNL
jgi:hypothetical protein